MTRRHRIAFLHPDLGLGGAERLVVDAAVELTRFGHTVDMYTAYYDPNRCFDETRSGAFAVLVYGHWFPRHILNRFYALCAVIRCTIAAIVLAMRVWSGNIPDYDVVIVDQVAAVVPVLKLLLPGTRVLFYCHFPDLLLSQRSSLMKSIYRFPLDFLEQSATGVADLILVNSNFTAGIFVQTFKRLAAQGIKPAVLYPAVAVPSDEVLTEAAASWKIELSQELVEHIVQGPMYLSINRFERKKGINLALTALKELQQRQPECKARLVIAGGYDVRLAENREHLQELQQLAEQLGIQKSVMFVPSFTDRQRTLLLAACQAVVYTPQHEHFGIVPLEAMASGHPVVAVNSGGPTESVVSGRTGYLCDPTPAAFADAYERLLDHDVAQRLGGAARKHVVSKFSRTAFGDQLHQHVQALCA